MLFAPLIFQLNYDSCLLFEIVATEVNLLLNEYLDCSKFCVIEINRIVKKFIYKG